MAAAGWTVDEALSLIIEAMLQSPRFLYRVENQRGDGSAWSVGEYELASRMSYILWGAPPDKELYRAADKGELSDPAKIKGQVNRMLGDPRAIDQSLRFIHEWLDLGRLDKMKPSHAGRKRKAGPPTSAPAFPMLTVGTTTAPGDEENDEKKD